MMGAYYRARAAGVPQLCPVNVQYDGVQWRKVKGDEEHRRATVGDLVFDAVVQGPRCWRLTAKRGGVEVHRTLTASLNRCKFLAAKFVRGHQ